MSQVSLVGKIVELIEPKAIWNIDLEDCDKVLRIDTSTDITPQVKIRLSVHGILVEEMSD